MILPLVFAGGTALLMFGLLIEAGIFRALHDDAPAAYKLFAVRDKLIRLVIEQKIGRREPHLDALYHNVNVLLIGCRLLSGPDGWMLAETHGKRLAHRADQKEQLARLPREAPPEVLDSVVDELREALEYVVAHHFGLFLLLDERRRELTRIQKARAKELLQMMPSAHHHPAACPA